jgi:hypothetical protein
MARLDQSDHSTILETYYRYGKLLSINDVADLAAVVILDANDQPTAEQHLDVPLFYQCEPGLTQRENGAIEGAAKGFRDNDIVVVKFEAGSPIVLGIRGGLRACYEPRGVFISGGTIRLFKKEGDPYLGTLNFKDPEVWGSAQHVWFLAQNYWVLAGGSVKFKANTGWYAARDPDGEVACTGIPPTTTEFNVRSYGSEFYMTVTVEAQDNTLYVYRSANGINWSYYGMAAIAVGPTQIEGSPVHVSGAGWVRVEEDRFFVSRHARSYEVNYPSNFFRLFRIGIRQRFAADGTLNNTEEAFTMIAGDSEMGLHFDPEHNFTVEGGHTGQQILQIY